MMNATMHAPTEGRTKALRRRAAALGPGYRGLRRHAPNEELANLARELESSGEAVPRYLIAPTRWVDRRSKLFEAAEYPDKGVVVSPEDLERIAANFDLPVPVMIEHAQSPFEIGYLTQVEALGDELFGTIALSAEADALIERSDARRLSIALDQGLDRIREVSIVRHPRVPSAQMFAFSVDLPDAEPRPAAVSFAAFVREGRITPAQARLAESLALGAGPVGIAGEVRPLGDWLTRLFAMQPVAAIFHEHATAAAAEDASNHLLMPEEAAFYRKHFPDISLDAIAARKTR